MTVRPVPIMVLKVYTALLILLLSHYRIMSNIDFELLAVWTECVSTLLFAKGGEEREQFLQRCSFHVNAVFTF